MAWQCGIDWDGVFEACAEEIARMSDVCWAVTRGAYSDYGVSAIFTDKALFDAYVEQCRALGEEPDTEEFPLNPNAEIISQRQRTWHVRMTWEGGVIEAKESIPLLNGYDDLPDWHPGSVGGFFERPPSEGFWEMWLIAKDSDTAIKAVNERRLIAISNGTPRASTEYYAWIRKQKS